VQEAAVLVAHQGGWDEILLVVGPILAIVGLLALAKRRVDRATPRPDSHAAVQDQGREQDQGGDS
jgi:hypothetical protein